MEGGEERFRVPGDQPQKILNCSDFPAEIGRKRAEIDEEVELSLGLSLNGRFGPDPAAKRLKRSSSVSNLISTVGFFDGGSSYQAHGSYAPLARTCSLPAVAADECRRRKELNSLKYMEARKKRMEKLKNGRVVKESFCADVQTGNGLQDDVDGFQPLQASQGSSGSPGNSCSPGISHLHGQIMDAGAKSISTHKSSSSLDFPQDKAVQRPSGNAEKGDNKPPKNALFDMPYVSTRGDGPNSTKIEGFLYRYRKGEEVKIVCVCHGLFLTPAEFVKHGGGGDVVQPLKHIVVNPFPLF